MDSRSRGSFCFKLTLNSIEQPLKFPRVALRSSERQTEKAIAFAFEVPLQYWDGAMLSGVIFLMIAHDGHFPANLSHLQTLCFLNCLCRKIYLKN